MVALAFADDTVVVAKDKISAIELIQSLSNKFEKVRMHINPKKSVAINVYSSILISEKLEIMDGAEISSIAPEQNVRYLGVDFSNKIIFD